MKRALACNYMATQGSGFGDNLQVARGNEIMGKMESTTLNTKRH